MEINTIIYTVYKNLFEMHWYDKKLNLTSLKIMSKTKKNVNSLIRELNFVLKTINFILK